jgi:DNA-directed RNA polymerase subunit RPC12/RpoP
MSGEAQDLLVRGIAAAREGEKVEARDYLERLLNTNADTRQQAEAWLWLAEISENPAEERNCLEESLARDPFNPRARRKLAILDGKLDPDAVVDPDRPMGQPAPAPTADPRRFVCPKCGGRMTYSPDGQSLVCESCTTRELLQHQNPAKGDPLGGAQDFVLTMATAAGHVHPEAVRTLTCQGCGASFFLPADQLSLACPYCGAVYVVERAESVELIAPGGLIPFKIGRDRAVEILQSKSPQAQQDRSAPRGLYLPAWSFSLGGRATWTCQRYQNRQWVADAGEHFVMEGNVLVAACAKLKALYPAAIGGFDPAEVTRYDARYLADWPAETYQINVGDASLEARQEAVARLRQDIQDGFFTQTKDLTVHATDLAVDSFKLVLLPFWMAAGGPDRPAMWVNGQTGKVLNTPGTGKLSGWLGKLFR